MSSVVAIRVQRNAAGKTIPYDKLYFFPYEDRELIPKVFGYALVLPAEESLLESLAGLAPRTTTIRRVRRDDTLIKQPTIFADSKARKPELVEWWKANIFETYDFNNRVAVVPILSKSVRNKLNPRYLTSLRWLTTTKQGRTRGGYRQKVVQDSEPNISELGYLATPHPAPDDKIRPICSICPRMLLHVQGQCSPGQKVCYNTLDFSLIGAVPPTLETGDTSASV